MKGFRSTWFLALSVIALVGGVYYFEVVKKEKDEAKSEEAKKILTVSKSDITELVFSSPVGEMQLKKEEGVWKMHNPYFTDLADAENVDAALDKLVDEKAELVVAGEDVDWKEFGLDKPLGTVAVHTSAGVKKFSVGAVKSFNSEHYLRPDEEKKVLLASDSLAGMLEEKALHFRDKRIFREELAEVTRLEFLTASHKLTIEKTTDKTADNSTAKWKFVGSAQPLDAASVEKFIGNLNRLRATDYVAEESSAEKKHDFGLSKPAKTVRLISKIGDKTRESVLLLSAEKENKVFVINQGQPFIFQIAKAAADSVFTDANDYKDKSYLFAFKPESVSKVEIVRGKERVDLSKQAGGWQAARLPAGQELDAKAVDDLLSELSKLSAGTFVGKEAKGLTKNHITLLDAQGKLVFALNWGDKFSGKKRENTERQDEMYYLATSLGQENAGILVSRFDSLPWSRLFKDLVKPGATPLPTP